MPLLSLPGRNGFFNAIQQPAARHVLCNGECARMRELAKVASDTVGFAGLLELDRGKPDGTPRKLMDSARIRKLG